MPSPKATKPAAKAAAAKSAAKKSPAVDPAIAAGLKKNDHVFLVDGSGYIFRAYHAIRFAPHTPDGVHVNAVYGFCAMLWKLLAEIKDPRPTHLAVIFDKSEKTFRTEMYKEYKAHRPAAAGRPDPAISADPRSGARLRYPLPRTGRLRGRRPDRDLCAAGLRGRRDHHHRVVRQGPHAARERVRDHVRHDEGRPHWRAGGDREIRRAALEGDRGAGADRRLQRQRSRRAGHRAEDRRRADRHLRRPRNGVGARERDQAGQAPPIPDRQRRIGPHFKEARHARPERAARSADRRPRRPRAGLSEPRFRSCSGWASRRWRSASPTRPERKPPRPRRPRPKTRPLLPRRRSRRPPNPAFPSAAPAICSPRQRPSRRPAATMSSSRRWRWRSSAPRNCAARASMPRSISASTRSKRCKSGSTALTTPARLPSRPSSTASIRCRRACAALRWRSRRMKLVTSRSATGRLKKAKPATACSPPNCAKARSRNATRSRRSSAFWKTSAS